MSIIIEVAEKLYKEANPNGTSDVPSIVYEAIEQRHRHWNLLSDKLRKKHPFEDYARVLNSRNNLSKEQAELCLSWGYKISHKRLQADQWIVQNGENETEYVDENNRVIKKNLFWNTRDNSRWNINWFIV